MDAKIHVQCFAPIVVNELLYGTVHEKVKATVMIGKHPYFIENDEWYTKDGSLGRYVLTDKAPPKAVESYIKYYDGLDRRRRF